MYYAVGQAAAREVCGHGYKYGNHGQQTEVGFGEKARKHYIAAKVKDGNAYTVDKGPLIYFRTTHNGIYTDAKLTN